MLPERVKGVHRWDFEFNQGDPLGAYRIDVFVNGTLVAPLAFEVVALPEAPPPRTVDQLLTLFAPILNQPRVISWAIALFGTALCLAPVLWVHRVARQRYPRRLATWAFATLGVVALPLSFWLYLQFYRGSVLALLFGFPGLFLAIFHVWPLAWIHRGTWTDSLGPTLSWSSTAYLTLVWSVAYGTIGLLIDLLRAQIAEEQG